MQKTWVRSLGWEDPVEKRWVTHSSIRLENSMDYSPWGRKESDTTEWLSLSLSMLLWYPIITQRCKHWDLNSLGLAWDPTINKGSLEYGWWSDGKAYAVFTIMPSSHYFILQIMIHFYTKTVKTTIPLRPLRGLQESRVATREESGVLGFPSRRGLTPRGSLECNPEIPAFPGEEN